MVTFIWSTMCIVSKSWVVVLTQYSSNYTIFIQPARFESARAVTGKQCPQSGVGPNFLVQNGPSWISLIAATNWGYILLVGQIWSEFWQGGRKTARRAAERPPTVNPKLSRVTSGCGEDIIPLSRVRETPKK